MTTAVRPESLAPVVDVMLLFARSRLAKASTPAAQAARDKLLAERLPDMEADLAAYFRGFFERNLPDLDISKALEAIPDPDDIAWQREARLLRETLGKWYRTFGEAAYEQAGAQLGVDISFSLEQPALRGVVDLLGERVKGITELSRETIQNRVAQANRSGESVADVARSLNRMFDSWTTSRAHTVALTESATAYNLSSLAAYKDSGIVDEVRIFDGVPCGWTSHDDPDQANGSIRTLAAAQAQPISHPNCQRAWAPVPIRATPAEGAAKPAQAPAEEAVPEAATVEPLTFGDRPLKEADEWATGWQGDPVQTIPSTSRQAIFRYTDDEYVRTNNHLRGIEKGDEITRDFVKRLDKSLKPIPDDVVTWRGAGRGSIFDRIGGIDAIKPGLRFKEGAYSSTSVDRRVSERFGKKILMQVLVPKGTKAAYLEPMSQRLEGELMLQRGLEYVVNGVRSGKRGQTIIDVSVVAG